MRAHKQRSPSKLPPSRPKQLAPRRPKAGPLQGRCEGYGAAETNRSPPAADLGMLMDLDGPSSPEDVDAQGEDEGAEPAKAADEHASRPANLGP